LEGSSANSVIGDFPQRQQSGPEQLGVCSAEHRALQGFEPVDLAFSLLQRSITASRD